MDKIRLLLQEQSDLGPHYETLNSLGDDKNIHFVIMRFKG